MLSSMTSAATAPTPGWSVAPLVAGALTVAFSCNHLVDGSLWPSSDLEGHVAMIELYRSSLAHGIVWPYDHGAAFGTDGIPYYAWPFELLLGALAQVTCMPAASSAPRRWLRSASPCWRSPRCR